MNKNLNQDLYLRFEMELNLGDVQEGLRVCLRNSLSKNLIDKLQGNSNIDHNIWDNFLEDFCRQMPPLNYLSLRQKDHFRSFILSNFSNGDIKEILFKVQILFNTFSEYDFPFLDSKQIAEDINSYFEDYPMLGYKLKIYKKKAPQILPSISKFFNQEIDDTLGLLETDTYKDVLVDFEDGLKKFLQAKTAAQMKVVINSMLSACDELSKIILNGQNKGFKHVFDRSNNQSNWTKFGLNGKQKEIFKNLKDWMDSIKHGSVKKINKDDIEMIISLIANFIRFSVNHHESI